MRSPLTVAAAVIGLFVATGCRQVASPTAPSLSVSPALTSSATSPIVSATGAFTPAGPPVTIDVQTANGNTIVTQISTFTLTGDFVGSYSGEVRSVIRPDGDLTQNAFRTFVGTLNGVAGTLEFREIGTGNVATTFQGRVTVLRGTGGLSDVHCEGTFEGDSVSGIGTYALRCH